MERKSQHKKDRAQKLCLVWLLVGVVLVAVSAGGLLTKDALGASFAFVEEAPAAEPEPERYIAVVQVSPTPALAEFTAAPATAEPTFTAVPTPTPTPLPTEEPTPSPTLHPLNGDNILLGMSAPVVMDIQIQLMTLEYLDFEQPEDTYKSGVAEAVALFQKRNGLPETGVCDEETFSKLYDPNAALFAVEKGDNGEQVKVIQEQLIELGYMTGEADGVFGDSTARAVSRFREMNGLKTGETVDSETFETLLGEEPVANTFRQGDSSEEILAYQEMLFDLGYLVDQPDGTYGRLTAAAVSRFQAENGLISDGCLGGGTIAALTAEDNSYAFAKGDQGADVKEIQQLLAKYSYMRSSQCTGYFGDVTEAAVKAFQKSNGLTQDGKVGPATMEKLVSDTAKKAVTVTATPKATAKATAKPTVKVTATPKKTATPRPAESGEPLPTMRETEYPEDPAEPTAEPTAEPEPTADNGGSTITTGEGIEAFIAIAESKLGCKYVRGAKGPNSFDCSGFVYWCLNQAGVKQSYLTSVRWRTCSKYERVTSMSELKRGDVLVFSGSSSSTGHVGIYLGGGKMIDAGSSSGCVVIRDSIYTTYWKGHFLMAYHIWDS